MNFLQANVIVTPRNRIPLWQDVPGILQYPLGSCYAVANRALRPNVASRHSTIDPRRSKGVSCGRFTPHIGLWLWEGCHAEVFYTRKVSHFSGDDAAAGCRRPCGLSAPPAEVKPADSATFSTRLGEFWSSLRYVLRQVAEATNVLADPRQSMLVRVVDADGKPVAGATITVSLGHVGADPDFHENLLFVSTRTTGRDGTARVARPRDTRDSLDLEVRADGFVPMTASWNGSHRDGRYEPVPPECSFKLERGQTIGGVVRDEKGRPVAGAIVVLSVKSADDGDDLAQSKMEDHEEHTDSQGRWRCSHAPAKLEGLAIRVGPPNDEHLDLILDEADCARRLADLRAQKAVFVMQEGLVVSGSVTDAQGKPVPSAQVTLGEQDLHMFRSFVRILSASTDSAGRYRLGNCCPGPWKLSVSAPKLVSQHRDIDIQPGMKPVSFRLVPGPVLKVRVVDAAGKPLAGMKIEPDSFLFHGACPLVAETSETDASGRWTSQSSPEGAMPLCVSNPGYASFCRSVPADGREHRIVMRPPVRIVGRAIDAATKKPIPKVYVSAETRPLPPQIPRVSPLTRRRRGSEGGLFLSHRQR